MAKQYYKKYNQYRGRRKRGSLLLKIIIGILVLILLACLVFMVILGGRVEYTDEGVRIVMPWSEESPVPSDDPVVSTPPLVIESPEPTPEPTPEPEPVLENIGAVEVTLAQLVGGTAAQVAADGGANAVVVEMKTSTGGLNWSSAAADRGLSAQEGAAVAAAMTDLAENSELYLVARVTCFQDPAAVGKYPGSALLTRGGNVWYDYYGMNWVSPADPVVRNDLIQLCLELAALGFDEILLEHAGYPYFGETGVLATNDLRPEDLSAPVGVFLQELKSALAEEGVGMSLLVTADMAVGADALSGITPEVLARYADRVWVEALSGLDDTRQEAIAPFADKLVILGGSAGDGNWAKIPAIVD